MLIWLKKVNCVKKLPISDGESFLESIFDQTEHAKYYLHKTFKFGVLTQLTGIIFSLKIRKCFNNIQNVKKLEFEEDWAELRPKNCLLRQSWAKDLEQNGEIQ